MTMTTDPELSDGVPASAAWKFVAVTDPALVEAWRAAQESYDAKGRGCHDAPLGP